MRARVTSAVDVFGEFPGQVLTRRWVISPAPGCSPDEVCPSLVLHRQRSGGLYSNLELRLTDPGTYTGTGVFYAALSCRNQLYPQGSRVPYTITLAVARAAVIGGIGFAQRIRATYVSPERFDTTPCPLAPTHEAASYSGVATSLPAPAYTSFIDQLQFGTDTYAFTDTTIPTASGGPVVGVRWNFDDPRSGTADTSTLATPTHVYTAPGTYSARLTVTDTLGMTSTFIQTLVAPGPPAAAFDYSLVGDTAGFSDRSRPGVGGSPVIAWKWNFGDPDSGPGDNSSLQSPVHMFSGLGTYTVRLTITDANGRTSTTTETITVT